ncbi:MAG: hypothetical protein RL362_1147 [Bacteroidota bacterium]|jgi:hypothetical protein
MNSEWKKGDLVRFLNDAGQGTITEIDWEKGEAMVEDESGFSFPHPIAELVQVKSMEYEAKRYAH